MWGKEELNNVSLSCKGTDFEGRRGTQEVELNNGLFLSFLVLLGSKIFQDVLSEVKLTKWLYLY